MGFSIVSHLQRFGKLCSLGQKVSKDNFEKGSLRRMLLKDKYRVCWYYEEMKSEISLNDGQEK